MMSSLERRRCEVFHCVRFRKHIMSHWQFMLEAKWTDWRIRMSSSWTPRALQSFPMFESLFSRYLTHTFYPSPLMHSHGTSPGLLKFLRKYLNFLLKSIFHVLQISSWARILTKSWFEHLHTCWSLTKLLAPQAFAQTPSDRPLPIYHHVQAASCRKAKFISISCCFHDSKSLLKQKSLFVYFKQKQARKKRGYKNNKQAHILFS